MKDQTSETDIQRDIMQALRYCGIWVIRLQVIGRRGRIGATGELGLPDLYLPGLGHLEVKHPQNTRGLSTEQVQWRDRAVSHGVRVATVTSVAQAVDVARKWRDEQRGNDVPVRPENSNASVDDLPSEGSATGEDVQPLLARVSEDGAERSSHVNIRASFRSATNLLPKKGAAK